MLSVDTVFIIYKILFFSFFCLLIGEKSFYVYLFRYCCCCCLFLRFYFRGFLWYLLILSYVIEAFLLCLFHCDSVILCISTTRTNSVMSCCVCKMLWAFLLLTTSVFWVYTSHKDPDLGEILHEEIKWGGFNHILCKILNVDLILQYGRTEFKLAIVLPVYCRFPFCCLR